MLTDAPPVFATETERVLVEPTFTEPKDREDGETVMAGAVTEPLRPAEVDPLFELLTFSVAEREPGFPERVKVMTTAQVSLGFCRFPQPETEKDDASGPVML